MLDGLKTIQHILLYHIRNSTLFWSYLFIKCLFYMYAFCLLWDFIQATYTTNFYYMCIYVHPVDSKKQFWHNNMQCVFYMSTQLWMPVCIVDTLLISSPSHHFALMNFLHSIRAKKSITYSQFKKENIPFIISFWYINNIHISIYKSFNVCIIRVVILILLRLDL